MTPKRAVLGNQAIVVRRLLVGLCFLGFLPCPRLAVAIAAECPLYQILIGARCVYKDSCEDGRAFFRGKCQEVCWDNSRPRNARCPGVASPVLRKERSLKGKLPCVNKILLLSVPEAKSRTVVLSGDGGAAEMFGRYIKELKREDVVFDLASMTVLVQTESEKDSRDLRVLRYEKLTMGQYLMGWGPLQKWQNRLENVDTHSFDFAEEFSKSSGYDLVCGSGLGVGETITYE